MKRSLVLAAILMVELMVSFTLGVINCFTPIKVGIVISIVLFLMTVGELVLIRKFALCYYDSDRNRYLEIIKLGVMFGSTKMLLLIAILVLMRIDYLTMTTGFLWLVTVFAMLIELIIGVRQFVKVKNFLRE